MSEIVALGQARLDAEAEQARQERLDYELEGSDGVIVAELQSLNDRMATLEMAIGHLCEMMMRPRIRKPVRDMTAAGQILYVVDEMQPPDEEY
jgi:hypothetical protein